MAGEIVKRPDYEKEALAAKDAFVRVAGEDKWNAEIIFALQIIRGSDALQKCSRDSLRAAVVNVGLTGVTLNPLLQQAFLVPRKGKVVLDLSYRGMVKIATDSGGVSHLEAATVHENDHFYYERGLNPRLEHRPADGERGPLTYAYAVAYLPNGYKTFEVMSRADIDKVKATSAAKSGPWVDWYEEMARKTVVKKLFKLLPVTDRMSLAVGILNEHEGLEARSTKKAEDIVKRFTKEEPETIDCPAIVEGDPKIPVSKCDECKERTGCPAHEAA